MLVLRMYSNCAPQANLSLSLIRSLIQFRVSILSFLFISYIVIYIWTSCSLFSFLQTSFLMFVLCLYISVTFSLSSVLHHQFWVYVGCNNLHLSRVRFPIFLSLGKLSVSSSAIVHDFIFHCFCLYSHCIRGNSIPFPRRRTLYSLSFSFCRQYAKSKTFLYSFAFIILCVLQSKNVCSLNYKPNIITPLKFISCKFFSVFVAMFSFPLHRIACRNLCLAFMFILEQFGHNI